MNVEHPGTAQARLLAALRTGAPETRVIVETYAAGANGVGLPGEELMRDLDDILALAAYAERAGAEIMTLDVNW